MKNLDIFDDGSYGIWAAHQPQQQNAGLIANASGAKLKFNLDLESTTTNG